MGKFAATVFAENADRTTVRTINGVKYTILEQDSVESNGIGYYKIISVTATDPSGKSKDFVVSKAKYAGEYGSIRAGIIGQFELNERRAGDYALDNLKKH